MAGDGVDETLVPLAFSADAVARAVGKGLFGQGGFVWGGGLAMDEGEAAVGVSIEELRRDGAAEVAVDARGVHVISTGDVARHSIQ
jgi:hypothetical protein